MADLITVRDGGIRPLTVDALERWLRSDDVERDGAMSAQQWAQLWFVMETIALWEHDDAEDAEAKPTEEDARAASEGAAANANAAAAKLAHDAAGGDDDDDAEGTAKRPSPAERRMADEIRAILEAHAASTNGSDGDDLSRPDELAAPLVHFALARGAAGVISGAHVGASGAAAVDALEWVRREKAEAVERICGEHHASFTRAMRELDGVRDGMRRLGTAARAQDDAVANAGGALLRSLDEFERAMAEERSTNDAIDAVRACADALRCAASCDEAMARGDLLRVIRRCDEIETSHVPRLLNAVKSAGASSLADFLRVGARRSRAKAEKLAHRAARDWLVAARDVAAAFGAAAIAREAHGGGGGGGGGATLGANRGADPEVGIDVNYGDRRRRAANAADAARRKDPRALLEALDGSVEAVRREASFKSSSSSRLWGPPIAASGGTADERTARLSSGSSNGERAAARRIDFAREVMSLDAAPIEREPPRRDPVDGADGDLGGESGNDGSYNDDANSHPVWNFPDLASYVDPDAPHAVLSLKPLLRLWGVFKATGNGDAFAAQMRRERASQLAADLDLGASARRKNAIAPDDFLRDAVNSKLAKLVGFFVVNERVARATEDALASRRQNRAMCKRACDDLGTHLAETLATAKDAAVARATHEAVVAAAAALRARGYGDDDDVNDDDEGATHKGATHKGATHKGATHKGATSGPRPGGGETEKSSSSSGGANHLEGLEVAARVAAASRYLDLLARHTVDEALDACALERLNPAADGKCSRAAKDLEALAADFATQIGSFYAHNGGSSRHSRHFASTGAQASAKCRECVETLAREFAPRVRTLPGFKESHAMQLVRDSEYLNGVAASLEARAVRVALGVDVASGGLTTYAPGGNPSRRRHEIERRWAPFDASERDAMNALVRIVVERVDELLDAHLETQADWAPDAPNQRESDAVAGVIVYLDGILRASSVVVPKRNARELAAHVFERVAARTVRALLDNQDKSGGGTTVKKFTAFAVRNLDLDVSALEAFADSMTVELAKDDYTRQASASSGGGAGGGGGGSGGAGGGGGGGGNVNGGNPLRSLGRLRGAMREPRAFCDLMTTDLEAAPASSASGAGSGSTKRAAPGLSGSSVTFVGAAAACMRERWDDVAELERMARTVDKYRELSATQKVMLQLKGAEKVLGFRPLGKKSAEGIAQALRARASELKVALSRGVAAGGSGGE